MTGTGQVVSAEEHWTMWFIGNVVSVVQAALLYKPYQKKLNDMYSVHSIHILKPRFQTFLPCEL